MQHASMGELPNRTQNQTSNLCSPQLRKEWEGYIFHDGLVACIAHISHNSTKS